MSKAIKLLCLSTASICVFAYTSIILSYRHIDRPNDEESNFGKLNMPNITDTVLGFTTGLGFFIVGMKFVVF